MNNNQKLIDDLEGLVAYLKSTPSLPGIDMDRIHTTWCSAKEVIAQAARALGRTQKYFNDISESAGVAAEISGFQFKFITSRDLICRKVVKGTKMLPAVPAQPARPEREVEVVEWVCDEPILAA